MFGGSWDCYVAALGDRNYSPQFFTATMSRENIASNNKRVIISYLLCALAQEKFPLLPRYFLLTVNSDDLIRYDIIVLTVVSENEIEVCNFRAHSYLLSINRVADSGDAIF